MNDYDQMPPPDALDRAVRHLNDHAHDGRSNWVVDGGRAVSHRTSTSYRPIPLSARSAVAVAVYCYGVPDPKGETKGTER